MVSYQNPQWLLSSKSDIKSKHVAVSSVSVFDQMTCAIHEGPRYQIFRTSHLHLRFRYEYFNVLITPQVKLKSNPCAGLDRPCGLQEVEAPRFQDNRHMQVVWLSALGIGLLYPPPPQEIILLLVSLEVESTPGPQCGFYQWKIPMTTSAIETATFRLVARCLNQLRHRQSKCPEDEGDTILRNVEKYSTDAVLHL
jgi:hypothetical protein